MGRLLSMGFQGRTLVLSCIGVGPQQPSDIVDVTLSTGRSCRTCTTYLFL